MLVLGRHEEQEVKLMVPASNEPTEIVVRMLDIRYDNVRLGFTAPREVKIVRAEIEGRGQ